MEIFKHQRSLYKLENVDKRSLSEVISAESTEPLELIQHENVEEVGIPTAELQDETSKKPGKNGNHALTSCS